MDALNISAAVGSINRKFQSRITRAKMEPRRDVTFSISHQTIHIHTQVKNKYYQNLHVELYYKVILRIIELTIVVSAMDPKLLIKMLQVTFTGGPAERGKKGKETQKLNYIKEFSTSSMTSRKKSSRHEEIQRFHYSSSSETLINKAGVRKGNNVFISCF